MTLAFAAAIMLAGPPRFLGPPEKKPQDGDPPAVGVGDDAPPFSADVHNAQAAGMARFDLGAVVRSGPGVVLIGFCDGGEGCAKQLRALQDVHVRYRERGLRAVSVHPEPGSLASGAGVTVPVIADEGGSIAHRYLGPTLRFPSLVIVDANGKVAFARKGYADDPATFVAAQAAAALP